MYLFTYLFIVYELAFIDLPLYLYIIIRLRVSIDLFNYLFISQNR